MFTYFKSFGVDVGVVYIDEKFKYIGEVLMNFIIL